MVQKPFERTGTPARGHKVDSRSHNIIISRVKQNFAQDFFLFFISEAFAFFILLQKNIEKGPCTIEYNHVSLHWLYLHSCLSKIHHVIPLNIYAKLTNLTNVC